MSYEGQYDAEMFSRLFTRLKCPIQQHSTLCTNGKANIKQLIKKEIRAKIFLPHLLQHSAMLLYLNYLLCVKKVVYL